MGDKHNEDKIKRDTEKLFSDFQKLVSCNYNDAEQKLILRAFEFAKEAHKKEKRKSGEPYIIHPVNVAIILIDLKLDANCICAGLLHDVVEDTLVSFKTIRKLFGEDVETLVKGVTKISTLKYSKSDIKELDSLRRMFIAMSKDLRVILIKLADRLHNIRTVKALSEEKAIRFCTETMNLFVPLAERLGLNSIKTEMEDICFMVLKPEEYNMLKAELDRKFDKATERIVQITKVLEHALEQLDLSGEVFSRFKHFYSLYKKMRSKGTAKIYDIIAFRVLVENEADCYRVLGEIHKYFRPVPGRIKDYIAGPKANGYRSLHTTLITKDGTPFEVQIRTFEMNKYCEYGVAAHWIYKQGKFSSSDQSYNWIRSVIEKEKEIKDSESFIKALQMDFSNAEIWVFTPKYKPISLPENSTPIDMAYAIHTELGNTCVAAKVNGKKVALNYKLDTGDVVEIITDKTAVPSRNWLNFAFSPVARNNIRLFFRKNAKPENVKKGKSMFEEYSKENGYLAGNLLTDKQMDRIKKKYYIYSIDDLFASIATGGVKLQDIFNIVRAHEEGEQKNVDTPVLIEKSDAVSVKLAHCCNPLPKDKIFGVQTGTGIVVHREKCQLLKSIEQDRYLTAEWKDNVNFDFDLNLKIVGKDKSGIATEIMNELYKQKLKLSMIVAKSVANNMFEMQVSLKVKNYNEYKYIKESLEKIDFVTSVTRGDAKVC